MIPTPASAGTGDRRALVAPGKAIAWLGGTVVPLEQLPPGVRMSKETGRKAATKASKTLTSRDTSTKSKSSAASALSQTGAPERETSKRAATKASSTLRDGRTSRQSKSAAGSALSQRQRGGGQRGR